MLGTRAIFSYSFVTQSARLGARYVPATDGTSETVGLLMLASSDDNTLPDFLVSQMRSKAALIKANVIIAANPL